WLAAICELCIHLSASKTPIASSSSMAGWPSNLFANAATS
ncbi:hypothetical protein A2U01_0069456, partial [Trifolium medium]|nr:hypothetical protein [Trifolium medium]